MSRTRKLVAAVLAVVLSLWVGVTVVGADNNTREKGPFVVYDTQEMIQVPGHASHHRPNVRQGEQFPPPDPGISPQGAPTPVVGR